MGKFTKIIFSIVVATFLFGGFTVDTMFVNASSDKVTPQEARKAVKWQIKSEQHTEKEGSNWTHKKLKIEKAVDVIDPSGNLVAYLVNITENGQPAGFAMVSAFYDEEPIIAWSDGGQAFTPKKVEGKLKDKQSSKIVAEQVVWLGGIKFAAKFTYKDGTSSIVDIDGIEAPQSIVTEKFPVPTKENKDARKAWKLMNKIQLGDVGTDYDGVTNEDPSGFETNYNSIHKNYIDTNVNMKQWYYEYSNGAWQATGCSPTAGSNIMKYWADKGYTSLNPKGSQSDIVMALRKEMGTTQSKNGTGETSYWNIDDGLQSYARKNGLSKAVATNHDFALFSTVVTEIDAKRPALQSYWRQTYFGDHTVTIVGYKEYQRAWYESNSQYVIVRNNFVNENNIFNLWVRWDTWTTNVVTTFNPNP